MSELEAALKMDPAAFRAAYAAEKPEAGEENLVFFCQIGRRGDLATQLALRLGYSGYKPEPAPVGEGWAGGVRAASPSLTPVSTGPGTTRGPIESGPKCWRRPEAAMALAPGKAAAEPKHSNKVLTQHRTSCFSARLLLAAFTVPSCLHPKASSLEEPQP